MNGALLPVKSDIMYRGNRSGPDMEPYWCGRMLVCQKWTRSGSGSLHQPDVSMQISLIGYTNVSVTDCLSLYINLQKPHSASFPMWVGDRLHSPRGP